jgi:hypothetical protein
MTFSVTTNPTNAELGEAVNYLLANFSQTMAINPNTGYISTANFGVVSYLYKYLQIKYADSYNGQVNFSNVPTNRLYYGIRNNDSFIESTTPADYQWLPVNGGFGTTKFFWYNTTGGRQLEIYIGPLRPSPTFVKDNGSSIDLDFVTNADNRTDPVIPDQSSEIQALQQAIGAIPYFDQSSQIQALEQAIGSITYLDQTPQIQALEQAIGSIPQPQLGTMAAQNEENFVPYINAISPVDLNAKSLTNVSHLGINTTTVPTTLLRAFGDNTLTSRISIRGYSSDANSSSMRVTKFRNTYAAPQAPFSGDSLGKFELAGYGTTSSDGYAQASFEGVATENWGAVARGTKTLINVTPNGTITQATAVTIDQDKSVTFATTASATTFIGALTGTASGNLVSASIVSANGFAGTVAAGQAANITLTTTITGLLKGNGTAISAAVANTDYIPLSTVLTKTADYTITGTDTWIINNKTGSALTLTFPAASAWTGRSITVKNMQAQLVNSASSNIVPIDSTTAGTAILLGVIGNWATMVSDGTNWVIMQTASNNNLLLE